MSENTSYINAFKHYDNIYVWERGPEGRRLIRYECPMYFFIEDENGEYTGLYGNKLKKIEFDSGHEFYEQKARLKREGVQLYESDITPIQRILSKYYYQKPAPTLFCSYLDIEVDYDKNIGFSSVENPYAPINSVALYHDWCNKKIVLTVPPKNWDGFLDEDLKRLADIIICENEEELLLRLILELQPSDALVGWNSQLFDLPYICKRVLKILGEEYLSKLSFEHGRTPKFDEVVIYNKPQTKVVLDGRLNIDYLELFKKFEMESRPSYKLESISNELLPNMSKLEYEGTLFDLYRKDFNYFLRYNIRDVECLHGFEEKLGYIALANEMYHEATGQFANIMGTIKLAELSIANYCHYILDVKVPDTKEVDTDFGGVDSAKGAYVLKPKPGLQKWIGSVDIASLYPSSIRSINISPETLIGQFELNVNAFELIFESKDETRELTAILETDRTHPKSITHSISKWKEIFQENSWAISGYGTIYDQSKEGIIPAILSLWYDKRKQYKKLLATAKQDNKKEDASFYDRMQYCYKIKLNSLYGALLNQHFRFYDKRMGESTTGTGRAILRHMCAKVNECLSGSYEALGESIVYGDSVAANSLIRTQQGQHEIRELFKQVDNKIGNKEYYHPTNLQTLTYDPNNNSMCYKPVKYIMRHKANKQMYRVHISNMRYVDVTEDHSLMAYVDAHDRTTENPAFITEVKPEELLTKESYLIIPGKHLHYNFGLISITQIEKIDYIDYVYDIEVEETHTFFANDILVHNTDSSYFKTGTDNVFDAIEIADTVQEVINLTFPTFMRKAFFCQPGYDQYITAEREVVASAGIFVTPKRYILRLVNQDGDDCDKLKIMGLDTKKTILPLFIRNKLNDFLGRFLRGEDWEVISREIVEYKKELRNDPDISILGLPKGVNKVEYYYNLYEADEYANIPGHIRASIYYNLKLKEFNDTESIPIVSSMKIKVFYLKNPDKKFKSVALPVDAETVPKWFIDHIEVDKEKQIERLIDNPLKNILKAINVTPPTAQTILLDDELEF